MHPHRGRFPILGFRFPMFGMSVARGTTFDWRAWAPSGGPGFSHSRQPGALMGEDAPGRLAALFVKVAWASAINGLG
jgi:hypothetical protein